MTQSLSSIVHIILSSYGLPPHTFTDDSFSDHYGKRTSLLLYKFCENLQDQSMILTENVALSQSQWKFSGFTSGKQLKNQTAFNKSGLLVKPWQGPSFLLFLHLLGSSSIFLSRESTVQKGKGWDKSPADLHSSRMWFFRCKTPGNNCWHCSQMQLLGMHSRGTKGTWKLDVQM